MHEQLRKTYPRWNKSNTPSAYTLTDLPSGGGLVLNPTGSTNPALGGASILIVPASPFSPLPVPTFFFSFFSASSPSAPSSSTSISSSSTDPPSVEILGVRVEALDPARVRLDGACISSRDVEASFLVLTSDRIGSAVSSPEASREEGCMVSATSAAASLFWARFRLGAIVIVVVNEVV